VLLIALGQRVVGVAAIAFEEGAGLDGEGFVQDVALDMAGRGEQHLARADGALDAAAHGHLFGHHIALDEGLVADDEAGRVDVAFDLAVDLDIAGRGQRAGDHEVAADDRRRRGRAHRALGLRRGGGGLRRGRGRRGSILTLTREHGGQPR
jgi:hypothetical protein